MIFQIGKATGRPVITSNVLLLLAVLTSNNSMLPGVILPLSHVDDEAWCSIVCPALNISEQIFSAVSWKMATPFRLGFDISK